jgi:hypothetical protein
MPPSGGCCLLEGCHDEEGRADACHYWVNNGGVRMVDCARDAFSGIPMPNRAEPRHQGVPLKSAISGASPDPARQDEGGRRRWSPVRRRGQHGDARRGRVPSISRPSIPITVMVITRIAAGGCWPPGRSMLGDDACQGVHRHSRSPLRRLRTSCPTRGRSSRRSQVALWASINSP